jgi:hypothetical protein
MTLGCLAPYRRLSIGMELRSTHLILYKKNSDSNKKFSAADIIQSVEFLMDNILVMLGGQV